jgi:thymidylate synthase (FAD)
MKGDVEILSEAEMKKLEAVPEVTLMAITPHAEDVIERACRTCYLSFNRYNPPTSAEELIKKVIRKKHHSVLEHAMATFRIKGGSRVFTHELVRHRLMSPSQESQRYVQYGVTRDYDIVAPPSIKDSPFFERYMTMAAEAERLYADMVEAGLPKEDARYILPNATTSEIVISANLREYRHIFEVRCHPRAHWEIQIGRASCRERV